MPRGAEFDNGVVQSDNAVEAGQTAVHGAGNDVKANEPPARAHKTAGLPEGLDEIQDNLSSGGSRGNQVGSGKGGHEPHSDGSGKGLGAHKANHNLDAENLPDEAKLRQ